MYTSGVVYTIDMLKNITFSVEEEVIAKAREAAKARDTTLNELVRTWIADYADGTSRRDRLETMFKNLRHLDAGRKFTRDEMNERS